VVDGHLSTFSVAAISNGQSVGATMTSRIGGVPTDTNSFSMAMATVNGEAERRQSLG